MGSTGSFRSCSTDVQGAVDLRRAPTRGRTPNVGFTPEDSWGILAPADGEQRVPSAQSPYQDLYTQFAAAVRGEGPQPVPADEGVRTLVVRDAARAERRTWPDYRDCRSF